MPDVRTPGLLTGWPSGDRAGAERRSLVLRGDPCGNGGFPGPCRVPWNGLNGCASGPFVARPSGNDNGGISRSRRAGRRHPARAYCRTSIRTTCRMRRSSRASTDHAHRRYLARWKDPVYRVRKILSASRLFRSSRFRRRVSFTQVWNAGAAQAISIMA